jgi:hypothetical protein
MDFSVVPKATLKVLDVIMIVSQHVVHLNVTEHLTAHCDGAAAY